MGRIRQKGYIESMIDQGEHQRLDFKFAVNDSKKIARSLSAFANTDGGVLLLGVKNNGTIAGVRSEEEVYMIETAAAIYTKPPVEFMIEHHSVRGVSVVEVIVPKSRNIPHLAPNLKGDFVAFVRVKDENILANGIQMKVWRKQKDSGGIQIVYSDIERVLLNYLSENEIISFSKFYRITDLPRYKAEQVLVNLIVWGVVEIIYENKKVFYKLS